ncbi:MAG: DUF3108 domain-containing protein [Thermodesulfovibrio sp.]|nr:DUF3108 domain-containing protein [Thermodesulfovibrio sp.]
MFGKVHIDLSYFDFIEAYIIKKEISTKTQHPPKRLLSENNKIQEQKIEEKLNNRDIDKKTEENIKDSMEKPNESVAKLTEKPDNSSNKNDYHDRFSKFINERMKFNIYWMGIYAGSASVLVKGNSESIKISSEVNSASFISNFYYVHDKAESIVEKGKPKYFRLVQIEGKHRGDKEIKFDYNSGEIIFINHIKNKMSVHKGINKVFMDVLSGFFYFRTFPLDKNTSVFIDIFDSDKFATVEVKILKEEVIETSEGKEAKAILIKPELTTEGLFKRKGDIFIWISNDERKIPLKIETKVSVGKITAELKEYQKE